MFVLLALPVLVAGACLFAPNGGEVAVAFSHAVHVGEKNLTCTFCHPGVHTRADAGLAPVEVCAPCHDRLDRDRPPELRLLAAHYEEYRYRRTPVATLADDVRFSHRVHVQDAGLDCAACHGDVAHSAGIPQPAVRKADCMGCHAERGASNECATCHEAIDRAWPPPTHDRAWLRRHGEVFRARSEASVDRCELCHDATQSCDACHREVMPQDHTEHFRLRGHGTFAAIDRSRCFTCHVHRRDFCDRCHQSTRPLSHVAGFGPPQNRHCTACHLPAAQSGCTTCHEGGAPHPTADPMPAWHSPAMNCRQCHGAGVALPHPDPGHQCTACHR
ncbi:MAG TPA: cytochrome c3 family protein [Planctomycetota bacterium]|nr:cytochrome c3 family protein [Planctomycetota bacterium]